MPTCLVLYLKNKKKRLWADRTCGCTFCLLLLIPALQSRNPLQYLSPRSSLRTTSRHHSPNHHTPCLHVQVPLGGCADGSRGWYIVKSFALLYSLCGVRVHRAACVMWYAWSFCYQAMGTVINDGSLTDRENLAMILMQHPKVEL